MQVVFPVTISNDLILLSKSHVYLFFFPHQNLSFHRLKYEDDVDNPDVNLSMPHVFYSLVKQNFFPITHSSSFYLLLSPSNTSLILPNLFIHWDYFFWNNNYLELRHRYHKFYRLHLNQMHRKLAILIVWINHFLKNDCQHLLFKYSHTYHSIIHN